MTFAQRTSLVLALFGMLLPAASGQVSDSVSSPDAPPAFRADAYDSSVASLRQEFPLLQITRAGGASLFYDTALTTVRIRRRGALDAAHPLYSTQEFEMDDLLLGETRLRRGDRDTFWVLFTWGPSADPSFYLVSHSSSDSVVANLPGTALALPGNGSLMTAGRFDNYYTRRRSYITDGNRFREVAQPFHYIGLKTRSLVPITLYETPRGGNAVCRIDGGAPLEAVLADDSIAVEGNISVLVRTPGGLLGWAIFKPDQFTSTVIEGISWWGD